MSTGTMLSERAGAIARMTFHNPERHNAVSLEMWEAMIGIVADFAADSDVRVVVVTGAGERAFVSGADISRFEDERAGKDAVTQYNATTARAADALAGIAKPTIAMIDGYCLGGGMSVALCCDLRVCSDRSSFGIPAAKLGLGYGYDGVKRLCDVVGPAFAKEIFFTARRFDAAEALAMGLVNRVFGADALEAAVAEIGETIARNAPLTVASIKRIVAEIAKDADDRDLAACERLVEACFESADYVEGRRAFMEKRKPVFTGR